MHPKNDVNACEDFLEVIITGYITTAALHYLGMSSTSDLPDESMISHDIWMEDDTVRHDTIMDIASNIVKAHVDLSTTFGENTSTNSSVYEYTRELISLGLLLLDYKDAVREGDGDRIMIMWKYFMLIFKATGHTNYALEAQTLLSQYYVILPPC